MRTIKELLKTIWAVYAAFLFLIICLIAAIADFICLTLFGKKSVRFLLWLNFHVFSPFLLFMYGVRVKVKGYENIDPKQTYIVVSNHQSSLDILVNQKTFKKSVAKFLAKKEIEKVIFFGYVAKSLGIMVDRSDRESRKKSLERLEEAVNEGFSVIIYPEGTRNKVPNQLKMFKDGAFRLAVQTEAPILVQTVVDTGFLWPASKLLSLKPGTVYAYWEEPIKTKGMSLEDIPLLKSKVRSYMKNRLNPDNAL